jgi:hypothetical protein
MGKTYIPSPDYLTSMYSNPQFNGRWVVVTKIPIEKIKIDKSLFSFQNEVNWNDVEYICENFEKGAWYPVMVNPDYFLLDGQHRLATARKMNLKYIDAVVDNGDVEQKENKSTKKSKRLRVSKEVFL